MSIDYIKRNLNKITPLNNSRQNKKYDKKQIIFYSKQLLAKKGKRC